MTRKQTKQSEVRTVALRSGGTITVELDCRVFDLKGTDRDFVTRLVDLVQSYETEPIRPTLPEPETT
jgi:hypothetical protein